MTVQHRPAWGDICDYPDGPEWQAHRSMKTRGGENETITNAPRKWVKVMKSPASQSDFDCGELNKRYSQRKDSIVDRYASFVNSNANVDRYSNVGDVDHHSNSRDSIVDRYASFMNSNANVDVSGNVDRYANIRIYMHKNNNVGRQSNVGNTDHHSQVRDSPSRGREPAEFDTPPSPVSRRVHKVASNSVQAPVNAKRETNKGGVCEIILENLPLKLCNGPCLEAMISQATQTLPGSSKSIANVKLTRLGREGSVVITVCDTASAEHCFQHFAQSRWASSNLKVSMQKQPR